LRESAANAWPQVEHATITWNVAPAARTSRATRVRSSLPHERQGASVVFRLGRGSSTFFRFHLATGRAFGAAEAAMLMWRRTFSALALALFVGRCALPATAAPAFAGVGAVGVRAAHVVPATAGGPGLATDGTVYVLAVLALTNESTRDFTPDVTRFYLTDGHGERFQGTDSGSSAFVGVANPHTVLKAGDTRAYTVGFRAPDAIASGTISYEP
jgi:hypothetical protein